MYGTETRALPSGFTGPNRKARTSAVIPCQLTSVHELPEAQSSMTSNNEAGNIRWMGFQKVGGGLDGENWWRIKTWGGRGSGGQIVSMYDLLRTLTFT